MNTAKNTILNNKMIESGDIIGVGVSGGSDSMSLLHFLVALQEELDFEVVAIHVDHSIRENSSSDAFFVQDYCKEHKIRFYKFRIDVPKYAKEKNESIETAARECRYNVFNSLIEKGVISKIALAHHMSDQAETILLHIFRGSGVTGAKGMSLVKNEYTIRPLLETSKQEIMEYIANNDIPFVTDETNKDSTYARNFIRNEILPLIKTKWPNIENSIVSFGKTCAEDSDYIKKQTNTDAFIVNEKSVKIPLNCFLMHPSIVSKTIFTAFEILGIEKDIERRHIDLIKDLYENGENGKRISLPFSIQAYKEYDYITIANNQKPASINKWEFKVGTFEAENFGNVTVKKTKDFSPKEDSLILDYRKIPSDALWRIRQNGDIFNRFGGGTKKLKEYFIDQKIPQRIRSYIPVLASGNKILVVAGKEISEDVKITSETTQAIRISVKIQD
ncbi:MAG: tRNA lysidine(34) synthetase TilS [Clostridia bacterium]